MILKPTFNYDVERRRRRMCGRLHGIAERLVECATPEDFQRVQQEAGGVVAFIAGDTHDEPE